MSKGIRSSVLCLLVTLPALVLSCAPEKSTDEPPLARVENVPENMHGVEVQDPYRWLEEWENPEVQEWSSAQNRYAREFLDRLPSREALAERLGAILNARTDSYYDLSWRSGKLFAMKRQPPLNQPFLVLLASPDAPADERVILDPNQLDSGGGVAVDWYVPSPDGELVAVSLSSGGSESGDVHLFETATGEQTDEVILRVNGGTAGGDLAWLPDGKGFYYTRYPREGERPEEDLNFYQQLWFHRLETPASEDTYVFGEAFPRTAEIKVEMSPEGKLLLTMQFGDSGRFEHYLMDAEGEWQRLATYEDEVPFTTFGIANDLFLVSRKGAPRGKIQRLSLSRPDLAHAETIVEEAADTIVSDFYEKPTTLVGKSRLFVTYQLGGPSEIRVFDHEGRPQEGPPAPPVSSIYELEGLDGDDLLYRVASYVEPPAWYRFNGVSGVLARTALVNQSAVDFSDCEVVRAFAESEDGTKVPVNIIHRKGIALDGSHPVLLTGYGGYGVNIYPAYVSSRRVWIEQGGIFAEANIRGGGEFGETWHREGMLTNKQNCFDDFAAAMQFMIDQGYTSSDKLAILGGSNGGLLMGAMLTQHPDLAKVVISFVGIYDMIRSELSPNGAFNIPEFGTVKDPEQFKALLDYSPYHNVRQGTAFPSILFLTGANDPRVDPMHSRKMTALLQASNGGDAPILLRTSGSTGHGLDTPLSERIEESVDWYGFLFAQLGVDYRPVP